MRKPQNPLNHGLRKPEKSYSKSERIPLADLDNELTHKVPLKVVVEAWNRALSQIESQGHRVTEGPNFESSSFYGSALTLVFTHEWDNVNYEAEQKHFDETMALYNEELARFKELEAQKKEHQFTPNPKALDIQIERAEHRLANLRAVKAGQPLPFPDS